MTYAQLITRNRPIISRLSQASTSLAGLLQTVSGRLLHTGEHVDCVGWRFEVLDLDGRRIDKVLASRVSTPPDDETG